MQRPLVHSSPPSKGRTCTLHLKCATKPRRKRSTFAGNGFGDAAIGRTQPHVLLDSVDLYHLARANRSYQLREIVEAMLQAVGDFARQMVTRWKRRQQARATYSHCAASIRACCATSDSIAANCMSVAAEAAGVPITPALVWPAFLSAFNTFNTFTGEHHHV